MNASCWTGTPSFTDLLMISWLLIGSIERFVTLTNLQTRADNRGGSAGMEGSCR